MKSSIVTFGCRVNQADSLRIEEDLRARGGVAVPSSDADLVVVNTCSVTASADQGARQTIRRIARDNPSAQVVVTGCYATRRPEEVAALPERRSRRRQRRERLGSFRPPPSGSAMATAPAARRSRLASQAARRSRCACRPAARSGAATASSRRRAAPAAACRSTASLRSRARRGGRLQGDRADRCSPGLVRAGPGAAGLAGLAPARARLVSGRCDVQNQLARADGLHAGDRRARRRQSMAASRRTSTCRCSTRAIGCSR